MPTTRGWSALGSAAALAVLWAAFGEQMLLAAACLLLIALGFAMWYVRRSTPAVIVSRTLAPQQVRDGDRAIVTVTLTTKRALSRAHITDTVESLGAADFVADRVVPLDPLVGRYEVMCRPRGIYKVGPTAVRTRDPFGLAEAGSETGRIDRLVVYPAIDVLEGLPLVRGQDPNVASARNRFSQVGGEDFFTLRSYQHGDDLRKVHWPSSAKRDELMIRQLEMPWQSRALVVLDPHLQSYSNVDDFEHAVRGAASVLHHLYETGFSPSLWTGRVTPLVVGSIETYNYAMEDLATVTASEHVDLRHSTNRLRQRGLAGGALILVTGTPNESHLAVWRALGRDYTRTVVMATDTAPNENIVRFRNAGAVTVASPRGGRWTTAWTEAMERTWSTATPL